MLSLSSLRTGLSKLTCSPPLVFDVDIQICNYEDRVPNCDRAERIPECGEVPEGEETECREVETPAQVVGQVDLRNIFSKIF